jgi:hypothetical protein
LASSPGSIFCFALSAGNPFLFMLSLLLSLPSRYFLFPQPHFFLKLLLAVDFAWRTTIREHDGALRSMTIRGPRECVIGRVGGCLSSSCRSGVFPPSALHVFLHLQLFPLPPPLRRFFGCYSLLFPRLIPRPFLCLELLSLDLSASRCVLMSDLLCSGVRSLLVLDAIGVFLQPFFIAVNKSRL